MINSFFNKVQELHWKRLVGLTVVLGVCTTLFAVVLAEFNSALRAELYPTKGTVLIGDDVLVGAIVHFHPLKPKSWFYVTPAGIVGKDGSYRLTILGYRDGAPAGRYAVTIEWRALTVTDSGLAPGENVLPIEYACSRTTPLIAEVMPGNSNLPVLKVRCCCSNASLLLSRR